ncbi:HlyD family secretion protein [Alteromonas gilva]|uniref:HlyD family secretion protein n=1 Tax=Alteromonas gilva TaxID=2987522 RepID=A0ABT5L314_9ALTE|nr:HlyD family secretion protein [Alteromonas gilva]MDC8830814.1 HlyD family secretion protein [Alteromonas gilva]
MTPDKKFNRWMRGSAIVFVLLMAYVLVADMTIPMTPHSMVQRPVIKVSPRVGGEVVEVAVHNNQVVAAGERLFRIDPSDYEIAVEQARLQLSEARQARDSLVAQLAQAEATIVSSRASLEEARREAKRLSSLRQQKLVSQQALEQAETEVEITAANLNAAKQQKRALEAELGAADEQNTRINMAKNNLRQAELNLARTDVRAAEPGIVSNLQLVEGVQARANEPLLSLVVTGKERIAADFREKSISHFAADVPAWIVFDALPGQLFEGHLASRDFGVVDGQVNADGLLSDPDDSDRWVRDAQRIRVYVALDNGQLPTALVAGSRATVMLHEPDDSVISWLGKAQMTVVSWLHYVY